MITFCALYFSRSRTFAYAIFIVSSLLYNFLGIAVDAQTLRPTPQNYQRTHTALLPPQSTEILQLEAQIWHQINQHRQRHGLSPLRVDDRLTQAARTYSKQMADYNFYGHTGLQGDTPLRRVQAQGVQVRLVSENLHKIRQRRHTATKAVKDWMRSAGHRNNILMSRISETGIGIWQRGNTYYMTQLFVEPRVRKTSRGSGFLSN